MFSQVRVSKNALDYFRRQARKNAPLEIQAYLAGNINTIDEVEVTDFYYTKVYHTQTNGSVAWNQEDFLRVKELAESQDKRIVGDIHSHPNWDAIMSKDDFDASVTQQLAICGICSVYDKKTRVRFWTPNSSLKCKIIYT
jgi:proteasome lid subunit RPN8/RPN11